MKAIINGRTYDTETATFVAHFGNGMFGSDYQARDLYRKRNGEWFSTFRRGEFSTDRFEDVTPLGDAAAAIAWSKATVDEANHLTLVLTSIEMMEHTSHKRH